VVLLHQSLIATDDRDHFTHLGNLPQRDVPCCRRNVRARQGHFGEVGKYALPEHFVRVECLDEFGKRLVSRPFEVLGCPDTAAGDEPALPDEVEALGRDRGRHGVRDVGDLGEPGHGRPDTTIGTDQANMDVFEHLQVPLESLGKANKTREKYNHKKSNCPPRHPSQLPKGLIIWYKCPDQSVGLVTGIAPVIVTTMEIATGGSIT
jgi:hypothetical protein